MGYDTFLAGTHGEGFEAENLADHLYKGHFTRQFVDGVYLRAVHIFIRIVFEQITIGLNAELIAQHLLAVRPHAWQVFDVLIEYVQGC
jgi:hypothetical protein